MAYCDWDAKDPAMIRYHDEEWGTPVHDDRKQFEFLMMEVMQCGLSWGLIMKKREILRAAFDGFDYEKVAAYGEDDVARILAIPGMIRSPRKVRAIISNARHFLEIRETFGSFSDYLWGKTGGKTILYHKHEEGWIPASNGLSDAISRDLKQRGFLYVGSITIYSHLQAAGLINDHSVTCPRYQEIIDAWPCVRRRRYKEKGVRYYGDE